MDTIINMARGHEWMNLVYKDNWSFLYKVKEIQVSSTAEHQYDPILES